MENGGHKQDTMTRAQLKATATEYASERDAAKSDTLRAFDERNALLDARRLDCDWLGHRNEILEEAAKVCENLPSFNPDDPGESYAKAVRAMKRE